VWTDPKDSTINFVVHCHKPTTSEMTFRQYPYPQPYLYDNFTDMRDPVNPMVFSNMFYQPKQVVSWDDQWAKWFDGWFWQFTPIPYLVFWTNCVNWTWDLIGNVFSGDPKAWGSYPSMYNNWFAQLIMSMD